MMEGNSKPPPPFLLRTYEIVDDPLTDAVVSWSLSGLSFVVWNPPEFATDLLPKHFKHNNFSSFIRQLNTYGFRKVDPEQWEFSNEEFVRGRKHLLRNINRRKPVYSHNEGQPNPERDEFLRTIKRLEQENQSLQSELEKHRLDNREYESHLGFLWQILNDIDQRQRQLMADRSRILKPESPSKRRRLLTLTHLGDENRELSMGFLVDKDHLVESLNLNAGCLQDDNSSNDHSNGDSCLGDSMGPAPGSPWLPPISSICMDLEMMDKLDENETMGSARPAGGADREANDVFWQQFLNEAPDSWVMQVV